MAGLAAEIDRSVGRPGRPVTATRAPRVRRAHAFASVLGLSLFLAGSAMAAQIYRSDQWITECDPRSGGADCSITVPFWQPGMNRRDAPAPGSFAMVVAPESGDIGIVGEPHPVRAVLRIDRNPPIECRQTRYCIFSAGHAATAVRELAKASLILIEVFTAGQRDFRFSLTAKGYRAGIAQIRAWGYPIAADQAWQGGGPAGGVSGRNGP